MNRQGAPCWQHFSVNKGFLALGSSWRFSSSTCRCFDALDALCGSHCINLVIIMIIIVMHPVCLIIIVGVVSMEPVYLSRRTPFMRSSSHVHLTIRSDVRSSSRICGPIHPFLAELGRHGSVPASNKTLGVLPSLRRSIDAGAYRYSFSRPRALVLTVEASGESTLGCARRR